MEVIRPAGDNEWRHVCTSCSYIDYFNPKMVGAASGLSRRGDEGLRRGVMLQQRARLVPAALTHGAAAVLHPSTQVVGCIVEHAGKLLLCRRAIEPCRGKWTVPAGFLELHESTAAGAARETWEETGARVRRRRAGAGGRCAWQRRALTRVRGAGAHSAAVRQRRARPERLRKPDPLDLFNCPSATPFKVEVLAPFMHLDIPAIGQSYLLFRARLAPPFTFSAAGTPESLEARLFAPSEVPYSEVSPPSGPGRAGARRASPPLQPHGGLPLS
jgi:8-oxo-dGTP pyrophosphatase MutT (NUDIX family)